MQKVFRRVLLCALLFASLLLLSGCRDVPAAEGIRVMLTEGEGYTVISENPITVSPGGKAVFQLDIPEGYVCLGNSSGTTFDAEAKTLTVSDVKYPRTVSLNIVKDPGKVKFFLENSGNGGYVGTEAQQGLVYVGSVARCFVRPKPEFQFEGWSLYQSLSRGGELVSTEEVYDHTITEDTFLYANFVRRAEEEASPDPDRETYLITYDAGEGVYAGTNVSSVTLELGRYHLYENCLPAKDTFVREGYQLIGYNTKADGTGDAYSLGSKLLCEYDPEKPIVLYCVWAKESDPSLFTYQNKGGTLTITGYTGDEDTVVIPERIDDRKVTRIASGAFKDKHFSTMVIPKSVMYVESKAFGCTSNFTTLYMFDNIVEIRDDSFTDLSGFSEFHLNAARDPAFTDSVEGCFSVKWERLVSAEKPVLVVVSGSSSLYGLNSEMLEEMLGGAYTVVNYGTNAGTSSVFYMEVISHFLKEGDILIHAPEIGGTTMGSAAITWKVLRGTEYYLNVWDYVDMRRYTNLFAQLTEFNTYREGTALNYTLRSSRINEYGDIANTTEDNSPDYYAGAKISLDPNVINGTNEENLNRMYQMLLDKGVKVYMSCAPCNYNAVLPEYRTDKAMDAYMEGIRNSVIVPVISHIRDYILPGKDMYNSDYHPNANGRDDRTRRLYADLAEQMKKDGLPVP